MKSGTDQEGEEARDRWTKRTVEKDTKQISAWWAPSVGEVNCLMMICLSGPEVASETPDSSDYCFVTCRLSKSRETAKPLTEVTPEDTR